MKALDPDPLHGSFTQKGAKVVVLGYDADARDHAHALRAANNHVTIGVRPDTTCWHRASADGFPVGRPSEIVGAAEVVVVLVREPENTWARIEPLIAPGALVVFGSARLLEAGVVTRGGFDVALVTTVDDAHTGCRVAVHRDATGRALLRAVAYARAACGRDVALRVTSVAAEADLELAGIGERAGSLLALAASCDCLPRRPPKPAAVIVDEEPEPEVEPSWFDSMMAWRSRM
jgi:ketol-acid reductoisomerase